MKKVILILILFLSCYFIYNLTIDDRLYYLSLGDFLSSEGSNIYHGYSSQIKEYLSNENKLKGYNYSFTNNDYRIIDILKVLEYNEKKDNLSLNYLIKKADIITISLGMNDIYYKLEYNTRKAYLYIDNILYNYERILSYINNFPNKKVFILGYYNITQKNNDIFDYANYKLKKLCKKYNYVYIDLSNILDNNPMYFNNSSSFIPNKQGYEKISQIIIEKIKNN